jgi:hypothetical protein
MAPVFGWLRWCDAAVANARYFSSGSQDKSDFALARAHYVHIATGSSATTTTKFHQLLWVHIQFIIAKLKLLFLDAVVQKQVQ